MNAHGFTPALKELRMLRRADYHWMELAEAGPCDSAAAVRRFYKRLGGLIAAAYLLNAVDCHRENLIAAGEHPVLVDMDALWQVSPLTKTQTATDLLYRTGFFPNSNPESLQSRSSPLGQSATAAAQADQLLAGFEAGWRCLVGTSRRQAIFRRRVRRIRSEGRRCIYGATETYAAIIRASLQPPALTSPAVRRALIRRLARRHSTSANVRRAEIRALERLNIPYFSETEKGPMPAFSKVPPAELAHALRKTLKTRPKFG
jgi:lantibiotic modifying enzyme